MNTYILSRIMYCGDCGSKMIGVCEGRKGNWMGYRCTKKVRSGKNACTMRNVSAIRIEDAIFKNVITLFLEPQNVRIIFQTIKEILDKAESEIQNELNQIESEIKETDESINRYGDAFEKGLLDAKYFSERNKTLVNTKEKYVKKKNNLLMKIEDVKYNKIYFYQFKKYLYNIKLSIENKILNDPMVRRIVLGTLIQGEILQNILILNQRNCKIKYNIGNQLTEKIINYRSHVRSSNSNVSSTHVQ